MTLGGGGVAAIAIFGPENHGHLSAWSVAPLVVCLLLGVVGLIAALTWLDRKLARRRPEDRRGQVQELINSLAKAMSVIDSLRAEIDEGSSLLSRLEAEVEEKGQLVSLQETQIVALGRVLRRERRIVLLWGAVISAFFFGLGILVAKL